MPDVTTIAIHGAAGRMGRRLVALAMEDPGLRLGAAVEMVGHSLLDQDAGDLAGAGRAGVALTDQLPPGRSARDEVASGSGGTGGGGVDVVIDFTQPAAFRGMIRAAADAGVAVVVGTTGLTGDDHRLIDEAARKIAVLQAPNMSLGVNMLFALAGQVARRLGDDYDIEITEAHHRFKKDAPSGTAEGIARAICEATGKDPVRDVVHGRHGDDVPRKPGQIGMHALRLGDVVGRHTVSFATLGEELQLTHIASSRDIFARGALTAAKWLKGKPAGRYTMADVLGL
jgi:4-hydroxy-tetrahydrodipicolinate reductase